MKQALAIALAICLTCGVAQAADLNVTVTSGGLSSVDVAPGDVVSYTVTGVLTDDLNEGLALVGFDLSFDGGDLAQADDPSAASNMYAFLSPQGINNPAGYGGTIVAGDLLQVGGGQNTINNDISNAPYPLGPLVMGVAWPAADEVLVTGTLTAPMVDGPYTLSLSNLFANVIMEGETGNPPAPHNFWKTEAAGAGTIGNLTINVGPPAACTFDVSMPPACSIDGRQPHDLNNPAILQGFDSIEMGFSCAGAAVPSSNAADYVPSDAGLNVTGVTVVNSVATVQFDRPITAGVWTCITYDPSGDKVCLGSLPADVNSDRLAAPNDILAVIDCINGAAVIPCDPWQVDADRQAGLAPPDILRVIDMLNGAGAFSAWLGEELPDIPECP